jgi:hypothetical protein
MNSCTANANPLWQFKNYIFRCTHSHMTITQVIALRVMSTETMRRYLLKKIEDFHIYTYMCVLWFESHALLCELTP